MKPWLKEWILEEHKEWKNNVYGQCKSWLDNGLQAKSHDKRQQLGCKSSVAWMQKEKYCMFGLMRRSVISAPQKN